MDKEVWIKEFKGNMKKMNVPINQEQVEKLYKYMELLIEWNNKMNLTSIIEPKEIMIKHYIDSISIYPYIKDNDSVIDIGTGAGFPGIPIHIIKEKNQMMLLDSLNKRVNFLNLVINELKLSNIVAIHGRAEEFANELNQRERYDRVISRAVAPLNILLEYMLPFVKIGGSCICMKSGEIEEELVNAEHALYELGGKVQKIDRFNLINTDIKRSIIVIQKINKTPTKYPRKSGIPSKKPL